MEPVFERVNRSLGPWTFFLSILVAMLVGLVVLHLTVPGDSATTVIPGIMIGLLLIAVLFNMPIARMRVFYNRIEISYGFFFIRHFSVPRHEINSVYFVYGEDSLNSMIEPSGWLEFNYAGMTGAVTIRSLGRKIMFGVEYADQDAKEICDILCIEQSGINLEPEQPDTAHSPDTTALTDLNIPPATATTALTNIHSPAIDVAAKEKKTMTRTPSDVKPRHRLRVAGYGALYEFHAHSGGYKIVWFIIVIVGILRLFRTIDAGLSITNLLMITLLVAGTWYASRRYPQSRTRVYPQHIEISTGWLYHVKHHIAVEEITSIQIVPNSDITSFGKIDVSSSSEWAGYIPVGPFGMSGAIAILAGETGYIVGSPDPKIDRESIRKRLGFVDVKQGPRKKLVTDDYDLPTKEYW